MSVTSEEDPSTTMGIAVVRYWCRNIASALRRSDEEYIIPSRTWSRMYYGSPSRFHFTSTEGTRYFKISVDGVTTAHVSGSSEERVGHTIGVIRKISREKSLPTELVIQVCRHGCVRRMRSEVPAYGCKEWVSQVEVLCKSRAEASCLFSERR